MEINKEPAEVFILKIRIFLFLFFVVIHISVGAQIPSYIPANGLVAWYPFNCNANDLGVNRNNGTVKGATLTADRFGNANSAYYFDGISNYISASAIPALDFTNQLSISVWIKLDDYSLNTSSEQGRAIIGKQRSPDQTGFNILAVERTRLYAFGLDNGMANATVDATDILSLSTWHNIVSVYDGMTMYLYRDGHLIHTSPFSLTLTPSAQPLCIGREGLIKRYFKGSIDDVALWNRALTPAEVSQIYNSIGMITGPAAVSVGKTITLVAAMPGGKWSSSSPGIATVGGIGEVTGVTAGRAVIWYSVANDCGSDRVIARMPIYVSSTQSPPEETPEEKPVKQSKETAVKPPEKTLVKPTEILPGTGPLIMPKKMPVTLPVITPVKTFAVPFVPPPLIQSEKIPVISLVLTPVKPFVKSHVALQIVPPVIPIEIPVEILKEKPEVLPVKTPNPADAFSIMADPEKEELTIKIDTGAYTSVTIKDKTEKVMIKQIIKGAKTKVDISALLPGSYYLILEKDGYVKTTMFVKDK
jgi:hypothetical protein